MAEARYMEEFADMQRRLSNDHASKVTSIELQITAELERALACIAAEEMRALASIAAEEIRATDRLKEECARLQNKMTEKSMLERSPESWVSSATCDEWTSNLGTRLQNKMTEKSMLERSPESCMSSTTCEEGASTSRSFSLKGRESPRTPVSTRSGHDKTREFLESPPTSEGSCAGGSLRSRSSLSMLQRPLCANEDGHKKHNKISESKCTKLAENSIDATCETSHDLTTASSPLDLFTPGDCSQSTGSVITASTTFHSVSSVATASTTCSTVLPSLPICIEKLSTEHTRKASFMSWGSEKSEREDDTVSNNVLAPKGSTFFFACTNLACGAKWLRYKDAMSSPRACRSHPGFWSPPSREGFWDGFWSCCGAQWTEPGCTRGKHTVVNLCTTKVKCWRCSQYFIQFPETADAENRCIDGEPHDPGPEWPSEAFQARWQRSSVDGPGWFAEKPYPITLDPTVNQFIQASLQKLGWTYSGFHPNCLHYISSRLRARLKKFGHDSTTVSSSLNWYQRRLEKDPHEREVLDSMFSINITRFNRDPIIFTFIQSVAFPEIIRCCKKQGDSPVFTLRVWSCGCSSGEEAWSLKIIAMRSSWSKDLPVEIVGTDYVASVIEQAKAGKYLLNEENLKRLPGEWLDEAFDVSQEKGAHMATIKPDYRDNVSFFLQDVRKDMPAGPFHLICCRHSVFMYFDHAQRAQVLRQMLSLLAPGGFLITGAYDKIPFGFPELVKYADSIDVHGVYRLRPNHPRVRSHSQVCLRSRTPPR